MELDNMIVERKIGFAESVHLSSTQAYINQKLYELDLVRHRMELKWGVGRLLELAPEDLKAKWNNQIGKLTEAIIAGDVPLVDELVIGSCRGWDALQRSAINLGHIPFEPLVWEVRVDDGTIYRVVRTNEDAGAIGTTAERPTVTLDELVRSFHVRRLNVLAGAPEAFKEGEYKPSGVPMDQALPF